MGSKENASRELKIDSATISNCCKGKRKSAGHYKWKYVEDEIPKLKSIINLMSKQLSTSINNKACIKQYFENKAKESE